MIRFLRSGLVGTLAIWFACLAAADAQGADSRTNLPPPMLVPNLASNSFPALGAPSARRVEVAWNQYYDSEGLAKILRQLHETFPDLTRLYSIGKSHQGRDLWCLELTSSKGGPRDRKPGMYIDGNIHGNEVQGGEVVAYTAWYLCHQYGKLEPVTDLVDNSILYLLPSVNPDGRDRWFYTPGTASTSRSGAVPVDNDRDGVADEDDYDDLDGDGVITQMRIKDPQGRWKSHPRFPEYLNSLTEPDQAGDYTMLGLEGIDNDKDGLVNEDPAGGYDANRNWAFDWQPNYIQGGAMDYPFSLPETRAVAQFVMQHPNICTAQSYHNNGGMILRGPGREGGMVQGADDNVLEEIARRGEKILPFYRSMVIWKDLYTVWGGEVDWLYGARGVFTFTCEIWNSRALYKTNAPSREEEVEFIKNVLMGDGLVPWREYDHPTYGKIEIGGRKQTWGRTPVSFLLEEECHRNMAFTLYHAGQMPRIGIREIQTEDIGSGLHRIWVTIENTRLLPTRARQDVANHISPPDVVTLAGPGLKVLSSGQVTDRFLKTVEPAKRRPERLKVDAIPGMSAVRAHFLVSGRGAFTVTVDSAKGGVRSKEGSLP